MDSTMSSGVKGRRKIFERSEKILSDLDAAEACPTIMGSGFDEAVFLIEP